MNQVGAYRSRHPGCSSRIECGHSHIVEPQEYPGKRELEHLELMGRSLRPPWPLSKTCFRGNGMGECPHQDY